MASLAEHNLLDLTARYNLSTFFETGTGSGEGFRHAATFTFKHMFTCDVIEASASMTASKYPNHACIHGSSRVAVESFQFMRRWTQNSYGNVLWWLDAHFPGVDTGVLDWSASLARFGVTNPAKEELEAIMDGPHQGDVILIDDAFLFRAGLINQRLEDRVPSQYRQHLGSLEGLLNDLSISHTIEVHPGHTGAICAYPK